MKLTEVLSIITEESADLNARRKIFLDRYKKLMKPKSRQTKFDFAEKLLDEMLTKDEMRFFIMHLQKKNKQ